MDIVEHNRTSWNKQSTEGSPWCNPVSPAVIEAARSGDWSVILTPNKKVPRDWFGSVEGKDILCLASGGGQQAPVLAAAGATVTSFDNSDVQLAKDRMVAERDSLSLQTLRGDMADLSVFPDESFDIIFHPVSNVFCEHIESVWRECFRVLRSGGRLLSGFMNPSFFLFDHDEAMSTGTLTVKHALPFSDLRDLEESRREHLITNHIAFEFSHSIESQIGGQLKAGFLLSDLYEDDWDDESTPLNKFSPTTIATLAVK